MNEIINTIIDADVLIGLKQIPNNLATLVLTSPPYNVAASHWNYANAQDDQPYLDYVKWLAEVFKECYRTLRPGGRLAINIDAMTNRQDDKDDEYFRDIRTDLANILKPMGFKFYAEHVWYKSIVAGGGECCGKKTAWGSYLSPSNPAVRRNHEYILIYSKDSGIKGAAFKLVKDEHSRDSDLTKTEFINSVMSTWFINPETRNLGNHPVPFPVELVQRIVKLYSYPGDLVVDPFNGVGTTTYVSASLKRRYIGIDMDAEYCKYARERTADVKSVIDDFTEDVGLSKRQKEASRQKEISDNSIL